MNPICVDLLEESASTSQQLIAYSEAKKQSVAEPAGR
jgi:hypothetical protein